MRRLQEKWFRDADEFAPPQRLGAEVERNAPLRQRASLRDLAARLVERPRFKWRRSRDLVHRSLHRQRLVAGAGAVAGAVAAMAQNEMLLQGMLPSSWAMLAAKAAGSLATAVVLLALYGIHWHLVLWARLDRHLHRASALQVHVSPGAVLARWRFWLEVAVCAVHVPPLLTGELSSLGMGALVAYRFETLGAVLALCRLYLLWPLCCEWVLADLPNRHAIALITKEPPPSLPVPIRVPLPDPSSPRLPTPPLPPLLHPARRVMTSSPSPATGLL